MKFLATEKKVIRRHMDNCMGCGKKHGRSRVEEARVRRVEAAVRRRKRRDLRKGAQNGFIRFPKLRFDLTFDTSTFVRAMNQLAERLYGTKDFFEDVALQAFGDLTEKKFSGIKNEPGIVLDRWVTEDILETENHNYEALPLQHSRKPSSNETVCGMPWIRPHSDDRRQFNAKLCPGCFVVNLKPHGS